MADVVGGGTGATPTGDGIDGVDTYMSNVGVMPAEVVETNYSIRVLKTEFLPPGSKASGSSTAVSDCGGSIRSSTTTSG